MIEDITNMARMYLCRAPEGKAKGLELQCLHKICRRRAFAVSALRRYCLQSEKPALKLQMIEVFDEYQASVIGVQTVPDDQSDVACLSKPVTGDILRWTWSKTNHRHRAV